MPGVEGCDRGSGEVGEHQLRMDVRSSSAFWNHRSALALASSDGIMSRMVGQAGA